jgi:hypothetical protein
LKSALATASNTVYNRKKSFNDGTRGKGTSAVVQTGSATRDIESKEMLGGLDARNKKYHHSSTSIVVKVCGDSEATFDCQGVYDTGFGNRQMQRH